MVAVKKQGVLITKSKLVFECDGVLNPAVIAEGETVHLFYRAVCTHNYSVLGYCRMHGPSEVEWRSDIPVLFPQFEYESHGVEDPRIVKIDDLYYLTYTAYDGINALGCLAVSSDLKHFDKKGIIVPQITYTEFMHLAQTKGLLNEKYQRYNSHEVLPENNGKKVWVWDKNVAFFPRKINGQFCFLHRIKPDIQLVSVDSLDDLTPEYWQHYLLHFEDQIVLSPKFEHEISYIGGGCPPIETALGWLLIYHAVHDTVNGYVYSACAALVELDNPLIEISRLPYPLFKPELVWELKGEVNNVCFPTGTVLVGDTLYIYYGAADDQIAYASLSITALLDELMLYKVEHGK